MEDENVYKTKDLHEAAYLYVVSRCFLKTEPSYSDVWFVFKDRSACLKLQSSYWSAQAQVNVREYVSALRILKELIFSKKEVYS